MATDPEGPRLQTPTVGGVDPRGSPLSPWRRLRTSRVAYAAARHLTQSASGTGAMGMAVPWSASGVVGVRGRGRVGDRGGARAGRWRLRCRRGSPRVRVRGRHGRRTGSGFPRLSPRRAGPGRRCRSLAAGGVGRPPVRAQRCDAGFAEHLAGGGGAVDAEIDHRAPVRVHRRGGEGRGVVIEPGQRPEGPEHHAVWGEPVAVVDPVPRRRQIREGRQFSSVARPES